MRGLTTSERIVLTPGAAPDGPASISLELAIDDCVKLGRGIWRRDLTSPLPDYPNVFDITEMGYLAVRVCPL